MMHHRAVQVRHILACHYVMCWQTHVHTVVPLYLQKMSAAVTATVPGSELGVVAPGGVANIGGEGPGVAFMVLQPTQAAHNRMSTGPQRLPSEQQAASLPQQLISSVLHHHKAAAGHEALTHAVQAAHQSLGSGFRASFSWDREGGPPDTWTAPIAFGSAPVPAGVPPMELQAARAEASSSAPDALHPWPQVSPDASFGSWHAHTLGAHASG